MANKIVVILGPTATGKSYLAVQLAKKFNGEIISADSRQVYTGLNIGTGKITKKEMSGVRHHLLSIISPKKVFSVAEWKKQAQKLIADIISCGKLPIICGGAGLYIQSIVDNVVLPKVPPDFKLRKKLAKKTAEGLFSTLKKLDPKRAENIEKQNPVRLIRAIEIAKTLGKVPDLKKQKSKYDILQIGINLQPEELRNNIHERLLSRLKKGMVAEARNFHKNGLSFKRMRQLGLEYRFLADFLQRNITKKELEEKIEKGNIDYAKRQMTWFKRDKHIKWYLPYQINMIEKEVADFMKDNLLKKLEKCQHKVSTDTRKNVVGTVYFGLKGENFDGNNFVNEALKKGAICAVTDKKENSGDNIFLVKNVLETLQEVAKKYRKLFNIPIIVIGGSNGKTTSKELARDVLRIKYKIHASQGNLNNHIGVPLSILSMPRNTDIAIFEIGANHSQEHIKLLNIIQPTHVVVTNNGTDHLESFGSPEGIRRANKEIYDWALTHEAIAFVNEKHKDLIEDSKNNIRILYPAEKLRSKKSEFLTITHNQKEYKTNLVGNYNMENIELAVSVGKQFGIETDPAIKAISKYVPLLQRSQFLNKNGINFIVDCYNANPTSMKLSLQSFLESKVKPKGAILGDMLELGKYSEAEHKKIFEFVRNQNLKTLVFVGQHFKKALGTEIKYQWFPDSNFAQKWFSGQNFKGFTFLLKGSRGMKIEKVLE